MFLLALGRAAECLLLRRCRVGLLLFFFHYLKSAPRPFLKSINGIAQITDIYSHTTSLSVF